MVSLPQIKSHFKSVSYMLLLGFVSAHDGKLRSYIK